MPTISINGVRCEFTKGERIIDIANRNGVEIPQYCYHPGLSVPAQCRICLAEIHAPNPRNDNKLEPMMGGKLLPTCATEASEGMVVYANNPKAVANQKAVMEYLLINHPVDCAVCDQAGECFLQDYSYRYGRSASRFQEQKVKQPKKDLGPNVLIYSDRCIMCTRCVRFVREVTATGELMIDGRGNRSQIDVFPGIALDNDLSANVIDVCPVGALLDKDFLFAQRVWFLKTTPGIDPLTSSGDNIWVEHNQGKVYRIKPRENLEVNTWWISDEVRYGWKFVHAENRLKTPMRRVHGSLVESEWPSAYRDAIETMRSGPLAVVVSPFLTCEEAYLLAKTARRIDPAARFAIGPVPRRGEDVEYPNPAAGRPFIVRAEKAPNARGVKRVLDAMGGCDDFDTFLDQCRARQVGAALLCANYPSEWATEETLAAMKGVPTVLVTAHEGYAESLARVVLPGATFAEKAGTYENHDGLLQAFRQAIPHQHTAKSEGQIARDLLALLSGERLSEHPPAFGAVIVDEQPGQVPGSTDVVNQSRGPLFDDAQTRAEMAAEIDSLGVFDAAVRQPPRPERVESDMVMVEL
ncbi:MAG: molybdopterin-dependent oxidoreductase [Phycisphaerales bacterium]|nr:molybdopterin-dependent oxidoreductase [Planctomycetota bacterium]MCH8509940.1 molybdopterin-dependent oxidoreductase [Phycisphaerales bacterium]